MSTTQHIVAPTLERYQRRNAAIQRWYYFAIVASIAGWIVARVWNRRQLQRELTALAPQVGAAVEADNRAAVEALRNSAAALRGWCDCKRPGRCASEQCLVCHACGRITKPADPVRVTFDPADPTYRRLRDEYHAAIAGDDPGATLPRVTVPRDRGEGDVS